MRFLLNAFIRGAVSLRGMDKDQAKGCRMAFGGALLFWVIVIAILIYAC